MAQLFSLIAGLISLEIFLVLIWVVVSWFQVARRHPATQVLDALVLPLMRPVRRVTPVIAGIDLSPLVLILGLEIAVQFLHGLSNAARVH